jgi:hypothetical protein
MFAVCADKMLFERDGRSRGPPMGRRLRADVRKSRPFTLLRPYFAVIRADITTALRHNRA